MSPYFDNVHMELLPTRTDQVVDKPVLAVVAGSPPDPIMRLLMSPQIQDMLFQEAPTSELIDDGWMDALSFGTSNLADNPTDTLGGLSYFDLDIPSPLMLFPSEERRSPERNTFLTTTQGHNASVIQAPGRSAQAGEEDTHLPIRLISLDTLTCNSSQLLQPIAADEKGDATGEGGQADWQKSNRMQTTSLSSEVSSCTDGVPALSSGNQLELQMDPKSITLEDLEPLFDYPMEKASEKLGIGPTTMKKICRKVGISRWPYRHRQSLQKMRAKVINDDCGVAGKEVLQMIDEEISKSQPSIALKKIRQAVFKKEHKERSHRYTRKAPARSR